MSKKNEKNLTSTNINVVTTGDERNGAKGIKNDNISVVNTGAENGDVNGIINDICHRQV